MEEVILDLYYFYTTIISVKQKENFPSDSQKIKPLPDNNMSTNKNKRSNNYSTNKPYNQRDYESEEYESL